MAKPKPARKAPAKPASSGGVVFDASRAVEEAAALIGKKAAPAKQASRSESMEFKLLKEGISQPGLSGLDKVLDATAPATGKKSNQPFEHKGDRQVGHNQTFGADVTRSGVPRRTAG